MFNVRPNLRAPGFNVREPEEEAPGFRLNADGTIGKLPMTAATPAGNPFDIFEPQAPGCLATAVPRFRSRPLGRPGIPSAWPTTNVGGRDSNMQLVREDSQSVRIPV
jgi:hypothetical protein